MLVEELEPAKLVGYTIIEVGSRQVWPFVGFLSPSGDREVRVYFDTTVRIVGERMEEFDQEDPELLRALWGVLNSGVDKAQVGSGGCLRLQTTDGVSISVSGEGNSKMTVEPWWFGLVVDSSAAKFD